MSHSVVTLKWIARQAGVTIRTVQRAAALGEIEAPKGASQYHRQYKRTESLKRWINRKKRFKKGKLPAPMPDWRKRTFVGKCFPRRAIRKWLRLVRREMQQHPSMWSFGLLHNPELRESVFVYLAATTYCYGMLNEQIWKSPETIARRFAEEAAKRFASDVAKFLRKFYEFEAGA